MISNWTRDQSVVVAPVLRLLLRCPLDTRQEPPAFRDQLRLGLDMVKSRRDQERPLLGHPHDAPPSSRKPSGPPKPQQILCTHEYGTSPRSRRNPDIYGRLGLFGWPAVVVSIWVSGRGVPLSSYRQYRRRYGRDRAGSDRSRRDVRSQMRCSPPRS
jgi:hypothetical protein